MHVEGSLPANLCLVTLLSSVQCLQFERFRQQNVQMVTEYPVSKQDRFAIMQRRAELTAISFDV